MLGFDVNFLYIYIYLIVFIINFLRAPQNKPKQQVRKSDAGLHLEFCSTLLYTKIESTLPNAPKREKNKNVKNLAFFFFFFFFFFFVM
jgi:hypothetical protein